MEVGPPAPTVAEHLSGHGALRPTDTAGRSPHGAGTAVCMHPRATAHGLVLPLPVT